MPEYGGLTEMLGSEQAEQIRSRFRLARLRAEAGRRRKPGTFAPPGAWVRAELEGTFKEAP